MELSLLFFAFQKLLRRFQYLQANETNEIALDTSKGTTINKAKAKALCDIHDPAVRELHSDDDNNEDDASKKTWLTYLAPHRSDEGTQIVQAIDRGIAALHIPVNGKPRLATLAADTVRQDAAELTLKLATRLLQPQYQGLVNEPVVRAKRDLLVQVSDMRIAAQPESTPDAQ